MLRRVFAHRPSPAMVVACVALGVALGGTGYAAVTLPRNSVGSAQLRSGAVTSAKVRDGSLRARDFAAQALAAVATQRSSFASRDLRPVGIEPQALAPTPGDVISLVVPSGANGYGSSGGRIAATGPSRLVASAQLVLVNAAAAVAEVGCRLVLVNLRGSEQRAMSSFAAASVEPKGFAPVAVSGGAAVEAGTYDVRAQCYGAPGSTFHRGDLIVTATPR